MLKKVRAFALIALCGGMLFQNASGCDAYLAPILASLLSSVISGALGGAFLGI